MKETLNELLGSKRFLVVTLCVVVCALFVLSGQMPLQGDETHLGFFDAFTKLTALLATLYGLENAASALRPKPEPTTILPDILTTVHPAIPPPPLAPAPEAKS